MTTLPPYRPDEHRVLPPDPPLWKGVLTVFLLFVVLPFAACVVVELAMRSNLFFGLFIFGALVGGLIYGVANVDRIRVLDDDDDLD